MNATMIAAPIKHPECFFIGCEWFDPSTGAMIGVITSSAEEMFVRVGEAQQADIKRTVAAARDAFDNGP